MWLKDQTLRSDWGTSLGVQCGDSTCQHRDMGSVPGPGRSHMSWSSRTSAPQPRSLCPAAAEACLEPLRHSPTCARVPSRSVVPASVTPWTAARQAPLSMGFSRQEHWSGLLCPPPGDLPVPGVEPRSPRVSYVPCVGSPGSFPEVPPGKPPQWDKPLQWEARAPPRGRTARHNQRKPAKAVKTRCSQE